MTGEVNTTNATRLSYKDGDKPDTQKMVKKAQEGGGQGICVPYKSPGDGDKPGVTTRYSNGNIVTVYARNNNGRVVDVTEIKFGDKTYYDWDGDGKIDEVVIEEIISEKKEEMQKLRSNSGKPNIGL